MEVNYQLTPKDFVQVVRQRLAWKREESWLPVDLLWVLAVILSMVGVLAVGSKWSPLTLGLALLVPVAILVAVPVTRSVRIHSAGREQFLSEPLAQSAISLNVSSDGLSFRGAVNDGSASWNYVRWREGKHQFVLFSAPETFVIVPKRAFTADQLKEFREYLRRFIAKRN